MPILLLLFFTFAKIALFNFGGGVVMISLIRDEILALNWLNLEEFNQIIAISEMTPGAIAINTATYVGYTVGGVFGSIFATLAIPLPSFIIVLYLSPILLKYKDHPLNKMIFYGLRAVVVGLIVDAAFKIAEAPFFVEYGVYSIGDLIKGVPSFLASINLASIGIFVVSLFMMYKMKLNPIVNLIICGLLGYIVFSF